LDCLNSDHHRLPESAIFVGVVLGIEHDRLLLTDIQTRRLDLLSIFIGQATCGADPANIAAVPRSRHTL
jgi:hypothetical protein